MKRDVLDTGAGVSSVANRGAVDLRVEGPGGFVLDLQLAGPESENLVRPLVAGSVLTETEADVPGAIYGTTLLGMSPERIASLRERAGLNDGEDV